MKTKQIPAIIMLSAGFITCIVSIFQGIESDKFLKILLLVLVCFYVFGCVVKVILDKTLKDEEEEPKEEEQPEEQGEKETAEDGLNGQEEE